MVRTGGSYLILLELADGTTIQVGRLGSFPFPSGWYVYVGSAMGGLEQRVSWHLRPSPARHWHLDYLRAEATIRRVYSFPGVTRHECDLARAVLALPGASVPAPRFGATDCRCETHLIHFATEPPLETVRPRDPVYGHRHRALSAGPATL